MAALDHTTTRRAVIGAMLAAPALALPVSPAAARPINTLFARRLAEYRRLQAHAEHADETIMQPEYRRFDQAPDKEAAWARMNAAEGVQDELYGRASDALGQVLLTPAPDLAALEIKLELMLSQGVLDPWSRGAELATTLLADVRSIA